MPAKNDSTTTLFFSSDATISEANGSSLLSAIRVFPVHNRSVLWIWALQTVTDSIFLSAPRLHAVWCSTAAVLWDVNPSPHFSHSPGELNCSGTPQSYVYKKAMQHSSTLSPRVIFPLSESCSSPSILSCCGSQRPQEPAKHRTAQGFVASLPCSRPVLLHVAQQCLGETQDRKVPNICNCTDDRITELKVGKRFQDHPVQTLT